MISGLSFYKMIKEEFKHHLISVFLVILYFLGKLLFYHFEIQRILNASKKADYLIEAINNSAAPNLEKMLPLMFIGAFMAAEYFLYLHSKKKSDFYMSLPIERSHKLFMGAIISSVTFFVPYIVEKCFEVMYAVSSGYTSWLYTEYVLADILCSMLAFLTTWLTMALTMIMTGHLIVAVLGFVAFCSYIPFFLRGLLEIYQSVFFVTYARQEMSSWWDYFSPISLISGLANGYDAWTIMEHMNFLIATIVYIVLVGYIVYVLYKKRPSEAAGRAMAFEKVNGVIRIMVVIPLALYCGYVISSFAVENETTWIVFGTIIGVVLFHGIMESIYRFDIRGMYAKKGQLVITTAACLAIIAVFWNDVFAYDEYKPKEQEVESIKITFWSDGVNMYPEFADDKMDGGISGEHVKLALALVDNLITQTDKNGEERTAESAANITLIDTAAQYEPESNFGDITITYRLKNGLSKSRNYNIDLDRPENIALLDLLFETEDFKEDYYELFSVESGEIIEINVGNPYESERVMLTPEEQAEFIGIYKKELANISYSEMNEFDIIARLEIKYQNENWEEYHIYDEFTSTINFLAEHGYEIKSPFADYDIISLEVEAEYFDKKSDINEESNIIIRDKEFLDSIKTELLLDELYTGNVYRVNNSEYGYVEMHINGTRQYSGVLIRQETMEKIYKTIE